MPGSRAGRGPRGSPAGRLLLSVVRASRIRLAALALLGMVSTGSALALPAALGKALDLVVRAHAGGAEGAGGAAGGSARLWLLACAALTAASIAAEAGSGYLSGATDARNTARLRRLIFRHIAFCGPRLTDRIGPGDLVGRFTAATADTAGAATGLAGALAALALPLGGLVALGLLSPWLLLAFLAGVPALVLLLRSFTRATTACVGDYLRAQGSIAARLVEALAGARTIAAAGTEDRERSRILGPLPELGVHGHRMWAVQGRAAGQAAAVVPVLQVLVLACGGLLLSAGRLSVGELLAAARYATLAAGIGSLSGSASVLARGRAAAARLAGAPGRPGVTEVPATAWGTEGLPDGKGELTFRGVSAGDGLLKDVDLDFPAGATTAVVGPSGSGKSLLAALAGRLAEPESGEVLLDGVPLTALRREELRTAVGYAFARPALLGETLADTIALGLRGPAAAEAVPEDVPEGVPEAVREAARAASADAFVSRLPRGYRTPCAEAPLSGGEAQRLGLARAFAQARRGRLLILDDATSSLDTATELEVTRALRERLPTPTRLVVAHRAATAARADQVVWLAGREAGGGIRAVGPHRALWQDPDYRSLFRPPQAS
ncbi:ABC transporter transmembrane domain-containing protein [Phaeacidiphilus oryzae]|uniref:ABC transporter transmembrane domain-containing protein n=1 Tax=Phaeacidiphilus oryzae TaxID=348818 RepID=UPI000A704716|nr:ABC transporter ATP-binding protein [Phaeacidiphilus oryzae]